MILSASATEEHMTAGLGWRQSLGDAQASRAEGFEICRLRRRSLGSGCRLLEVQGELDLSASPAVEDAVRAGDGVESLVMDLRAVTFIDIAGLRALARARERCERGSCSLSLLIRRGGAVERLLLLIPGSVRQLLGGVCIHALPE
jgi:anti-anti-sigma factor